MSNLCIIPARGGSKRIPKKNIKIFCGKPIIAYSIEIARNSNMFDEIMVSTDDEEIADIAVKYGADVPFFRSKKNADDYSTTKDVLLEVVENYKARGKEYQNLCCIYPTAVLATEKDLILAYEKLSKSKMVLPVRRFSFPPQRALCKSEKGLKYKIPDNINKRSQDLEPMFHDAGQWYWMKVDALETFNTNTEMDFVELPGIRVQDIDTIDDFEIAELKYKRLFR